MFRSLCLPMLYENASSFAIIFTALVTTDNWTAWIKLLRDLNELIGFSTEGFDKALIVAKEKGEPNHNHSNIVFLVI